MQQYRSTTTKIYKVKLKKMRKEAKLSLRRLAELSGVSFAHISKIENGFVMTERTWLKLKRALIKHVIKK